MSKVAKVFLIDDDKFVLNTFVKKFRPYDVELFTFTDPEEALVEMELHKPEIVFLDYNMPGLSGEDVIVKVSEIKLFCHCSLYLVTSSNFSEEEIIKLKTLGFYDIFSKPLESKVIESVLTEHVGQVPRKAA